MLLATITKVTSYIPSLKITDKTSLLIGYSSSSASGATRCMTAGGTRLHSAVIHIRASDVASAIGKNPYKSRFEVTQQLWKRYSPATFVGQTKEDAQQEAIQRLDAKDKKAFFEAANKLVTNSKDAMSAVSDASKLISSSSSVSDEDKIKVLELLKSTVSTRHGSRFENSVAKQAEQTDGVTMVKDNSMYELPICTIGQRAYILRGKIDRLQIESNEIVLVEIKTRMKRLFFKIREYENIQIQTYLQLLPGDVQRAKLIEQYMEESNVINLTRDDDQWNQEIYPGLVQFAYELEAVMFG